MIVATNPLIIAGLLFAPIGVIAPKGLAPLLFMVAIWQLLLDMQARRLREVFDTRVAWLLTALALWALVTVSWAPDPELSIVSAAKIAATFFAGLVMLAAARRLEPPAREWLGVAVIAGFAVAALALALEVAAGYPATQAWYAYQERTDEFRAAALNRAVILIFLASWLAAVEFRRRGRAWLGWVAIIAAAFIVFGADGNSAKVAALIAVPLAAIAWWLGNRTHVVVAAIAVLGVTIAPMLPLNLLAPDRYAKVVPEGYYSALHRLYIWRFSAERIIDKPALGWGLDASRDLPGGDERLPEGGVVMSMHPHNGTLQVWLELGVIGAGLLAVVVAVSLLAQCQIRDRFDAAATLGASTVVLVIANLSFGIWQTWWLCTFGLLAALVTAAVRPDAAAQPGRRQAMPRQI